MARSIDAVTRRLGTRYRKWKDAEKKKDEDRKAFFDLATEEVINQSLTVKSVEVPEFYREKVDEYVALYHPGWVKQNVRVDGDRTGPSRVYVILEEDPAYRSFSYVNKKAGIVLRKTVQEGQVGLDDERLQIEDPDLWEAITEIQYVPKALDELTDEQLGAIQDYLVRGQPVVKLGAPRKAKEDELGS